MLPNPELGAWHRTVSTFAHKRDRKAELHEEVQPGNELMQTARSRPSIEKMVWRVPRLRFLKAAGTCCQCTRVFSVG